MLLALGGLAVLRASSASTCARRSLDPEAFAGRATHSLDDAAVRDYLAEKLTEDVVENANARVLAARPLIETAIAGVVGSSVFRPDRARSGGPAVRGGGHRGGGRVALGLTDGAGAGRGGAAQRRRGEARRCPPDSRGGHRARGARGPRGASSRRRTGPDAGLVLPPIGVALLIAGSWSPPRRRAVAGAGAALALAGAVIAVGLPIGRCCVERGGTPTTTARARRRAALCDAMLGDLRYWATARWPWASSLWLTAAYVLRRVPLPVLAMRRAGAGRCARPGGRREAVRRGLALIAVAIRWPSAWQSALRLAVLAVSVALAVQGIEPHPRASSPAGGPGRRRPEHAVAAMPHVHMRRRSVIGAAAVATALFIAVGVALGMRGPPTYGSANVTTCNGYAELCNRPVNEVAFAATHNSMSGADQPNWFRAEHRHGIQSQLRRGIRGFLIDAWYGIPSGNLVASDFDRAPDDSAGARAFPTFPDRRARPSSACAPGSDSPARESPGRTCATSSARPGRRTWSRPSGGSGASSITTPAR